MINKRIKELAEQAELIEIIDDAYIERDDWQPFVEKFAELIIRECSLVVFKKTGPKSALDVLEHFGVKE